MPSSQAPRIPLLTEHDAVAVATAKGVAPELARLSVFQVLLRHPRLSRAISGLLLGLLTEKSILDARLRELVIMRIGWSTGSMYEWTQHWHIARDLGVPADDLVGTRNWQQHESFGPMERAVLAATDDTLATGNISPETWKLCEANLGSDPQVLLELVAAIGTWQMISTMLRSLQIPLEEGVSSWPPDGRHPEQLVEDPAG